MYIGIYIYIVDRVDTKYGVHSPNKGCNHWRKKVFGGIQSSCTDTRVEYL